MRFDKMTIKTREALAAAQSLSETHGHAEGHETRARVLELLRDRLRPELLNRIDEVVAISVAVGVAH